VKVPQQSKLIEDIQKDKFPSNTPRSYYIITKDAKNNSRHPPTTDSSSRTIVTDRLKRTSMVQRQITNDVHRQQPILTDPKPAGRENRNKK
jgi:hypothetical protein